MIYIVALSVGFKCPRKIHLNTQCVCVGGGGRLPSLNSDLRQFLCHTYLHFSEIVLGEYESGLDPDCVKGFCIQNITRTVSKVIIHENYGPGGGSVINDIALVRLNEPVPLYDDSEEVRTF